MAETIREGDRDNLLDVLTREEYRETLAALRTSPDEVTSLTDLAGERHTLESGGTTVTTIYLHHVMLPKLDSAGLVDYDPVEHTVRYRSSERVESWVDIVETRSE